MPIKSLEIHCTRRFLQNRGPMHSSLSSNTVVYGIHHQHGDFETDLGERTAAFSVHRPASSVQAV